jgi:hypothetical protein
MKRKKKKSDKKREERRSTFHLLFSQNIIDTIIAANEISPNFFWPLPVLTDVRGTSLPVPRRHGREPIITIVGPDVLSGVTWKPHLYMRI